MPCRMLRIGLNSLNLGRKLSARVNTMGAHKRLKFVACGLGCFFNGVGAEYEGGHI